MAAGARGLQPAAGSVRDVMPAPRGGGGMSSRGTADVQQYISKLTPNQVRYRFLSGYTAKVAGSAEGVKETVLTDTLSGGMRTGSAASWSLLGELRVC